jgi:hypothetical protein
VNRTRRGLWPTARNAVMREIVSSMRQATVDLAHARELSRARTADLAVAWNALINELRARRVLVDGQTPPDAVVDVHEAVRALMDLTGVEPVYVGGQS